MPHKVDKRFENKIASTISHLPGALPSNPLPKDLTVDDVQQRAASLATSLQSDKLDESLFTSDAFWRDQFSLTHTLRTFYSSNAICKAWANVASSAKLQNVSVVPGTANIQPTWATVLFTFDANLSGALAHCSGLLYLVPESSTSNNLKIWMLLTWLEDLAVQPGRDLRLTPQVHEQSRPTNVDDLDVLLVGAGQAGLSTAAWCKSYGLKYIVLEKNERVGDNWTKRYESAKLHTSQRFNDLPFGPTFTDADGEWLGVQALAKGYRRFVDQFGIDVWTSCNLIKPATFDAASKKWTAHFAHGDDHFVVSAHHIVLCTGPGGTVPLLPTCPGLETYGGKSLHSARYTNANAYRGKRGVVVGSANTGHDVAKDMLESGLSEVTMVQRGATYVVSRTHFKELFGMIWNDQMTQEFSDRLFWSTPTAVSRLMTNAFFHPKAEDEFEKWDALEKAGFNLEIKGDFIDHLLVRFGGHYMDCGVSQMIADGKIRIKNDSFITHYTATGLGFSDGSTLDADLIVWATGFEKDVRPSVAPVIGEKLTSQLREYWGVNEEGEVKGAFVQSGVENCWMTGGGCSHARYFTRFVALQILAERLGHPLQPYEASAQSVKAIS